MKVSTGVKSAICVTCLLVLLSSYPIWALHRDKATGVAAQESKPKGTPEMEKLKFYLGEWDYTESYPKTPMAPSGGKNTGLYTSKLGPGGNSLINSFHSQGPVGDFEGVLIMTWDPNEKAYKAYVFGSDFPGALVETGQFEGDVLVFHSQLNAGGTTMKLRNATRMVSPGKMESDEYVALKDAPEKLLVHVEASKK